MTKYFLKFEIYTKRTGDFLEKKERKDHCVKCKKLGKRLAF